MPGLTSRIHVPEPPGLGVTDEEVLRALDEAAIGLEALRLLGGEHRVVRLHLGRHRREVSDVLRRQRPRRTHLRAVRLRHQRPRVLAVEGIAVLGQDDPANRELASRLSRSSKHADHHAERPLGLTVRQHAQVVAALAIRHASSTPPGLEGPAAGHALRDARRGRRDAGCLGSGDQAGARVVGVGNGRGDEDGSHEGDAQQANTTTSSAVSIAGRVRTGAVSFATRPPVNPSTRQSAAHSR